MARVVALEGSAPRDPGATMAVNDAGEVAGSVSGSVWVMVGLSDWPYAETTTAPNTRRTLSTRCWVTVEAPVATVEGVSRIRALTEERAMPSTMAFTALILLAFAAVVFTGMLLWHLFNAG